MNERQHATSEGIRYIPIKIIYFPIGANVIAHAKKWRRRDVVTLLRFNSSRSRRSAEQQLETTHRRLVGQLSTSGSAWPFGRSNHRSCLIVSIVRIADITLSCANILCTFIDRDPNDVAEEKKEERERQNIEKISNSHLSTRRLCQLRETKLIDALRKKCDEKSLVGDDVTIVPRFMRISDSKYAIIRALRALYQKLKSNFFILLIVMFFFYILRYHSKSRAII